MLKIVLIGSGNVATQLGKALFLTGHDVSMVYSRNLDHAQKLAVQINSVATDSIEKIPLDYNLYIIAVADDAIPEVASKLLVNQGIVVHTSGSVTMSVLATTGKEYGVFYPLQTFTINKEVNFSDIPICIEGSSEIIEDKLFKIAKTLSCNVKLVNSAKRKIIHLAAVFACNFTTHLMSIADDILATSGEDIELLRPLIKETLQKVEQSSPKDIQTGPAKRGDNAIMKQHLELLADYPEYQELYRLISNSIIRSL